MAPGAPRGDGPASSADGADAGPVVSGPKNVRLRAEATVNGKLCSVVVDAPLSMWGNSLTDLRPDLGRELVERVLREKLALEIAQHLDVTVTEERETDA